MHCRAIHKFARISPTKARLVARMVKDLRVNDALNVLRNTPKRASKYIDKVICSAWANAQQINPGVDEDDFRVAEARVDDGPSLKRHRPRPRGSVGRILKRSCHITVVISDEAGEER